MPHLTLSFQTRAELFTKLATMEKAGLPFTQALSLLRLPGTTNQRLSVMRKHIKASVEIAGAGEEAGVFTPFEASLLRIAMVAGSPASTYQKLADYYAIRAIQSRQLRSKLALPVLMLVLSVLIQPIPELINGTLSGYIGQVSMPLITITLAASLIFYARYWLHTVSLLPIKDATHKLIRWLPVFGSLHIRRNLRNYFESLALLLEAGMPMQQAHVMAITTLTDSAIQAELSQAGVRLKAGATFAQAMQKVAFLKSATAMHFIQTGENSGQLPEMLMRYTQQELAFLLQREKLLADWLPKILYALIAIWVAYGLISDGLKPIEMPPELM
ncbi:MAG TPA: type II secretion system F family protein [Methyloradius sp.]